MENTKASQERDPEVVAWKGEVREGKNGRFNLDEEDTFRFEG